MVLGKGHICVNREYLCRKGTKTIANPVDIDLTFQWLKKNKKSIFKKKYLSKLRLWLILVMPTKFILHNIYIFFFSNLNFQVSPFCRFPARHFNFLLSLWFWEGGQEEEDHRSSVSKILGEVLEKFCEHTALYFENTSNKHLAYGRHRISWPMRKVSLILFSAGSEKRGW